MSNEKEAVEPLSEPAERNDELLPLTVEVCDRGGFSNLLRGAEVLGVARSSSSAPLEVFGRLLPALAALASERALLRPEARFSPTGVDIGTPSITDGIRKALAVLCDPAWDTLSAQLLWSLLHTDAEVREAADRCD